MKRRDIAQVYRAADGYRWRIIAGNGEPIASGEAYEHKADVVSMLEQHYPEAAIVELDLVTDAERAAD
jgi:phospholipid N-methyltransferase